MYVYNEEKAERSGILSFLFLSSFLFCIKNVGNVGTIEVTAAIFRRLTCMQGKSIGSGDRLDGRAWRKRKNVLHHVYHVVHGLSSEKIKLLRCSFFRHATD